MEKLGARQALVTVLQPHAWLALGQHDFKLSRELLAINVSLQTEWSLNLEPMDIVLGQWLANELAAL